MMTDVYMMLGFEINFLSMLTVKLDGYSRVPCMRKPSEIYMGYNYRITHFLDRIGFLP